MVAFRSLSRVAGQLAPRSLFTAAPAPRFGFSLRYLGTAGFVLTAGGRTVVLDPYLTRAPLHSVLGGAPLVPDRATALRHVPRADDVLVGHAHYDHVLDAPCICAATGARLIGSPAVCHVGRAAGLPERQLLATTGHAPIPSGPLTVRGVPSRHGKVLLGRVLFPGDITAPPPWPARAHELRHGLVLNWHVAGDGFSVLHIDSADFIAESLRGLSADVLCLCAVGRKFRPNYVRDAIELVRPKLVVPCHWDTMITDADAPLRMLPGVALAEMLAEIARCGVTPLLLDMHQEVAL
jgi:L-ascorbate metabolism protein UlaG (beta-lactamase superfamily)